MRKIIVGAFVSLDGVMQSPGGPAEDPTGGFTLGGWTVPWFDDVVGEEMGAMFERPFDLLLGRKTYDIFAAHWPFVGADNPIGPLFDRITKYVATRSPSLAIPWQNSEILGPDAVAAARELKAGTGPDLLTQGSSDFLQSLFASDLVDEINLIIFPVLIGSGKRLFGGGAAPSAFTLTGSTASPSGVVVNRYARAGAVATGNFQLDPPTEAELERRRTLS
jgi:dihydrofolate reductase